MSMTAFKDRPPVVLGLFVAAYTLVSLDRAIMGVLLEPIKHEFHLTDGQLGLVGGTGFAVFFGLCGLPIGRLVDRGNRRDILTASIFVFSAMTAAAAATTSFLQLFLTRLIVGAGEAGGGPAMGSMIADLYPPRRRATALAIYYAGSPLGSLLAYLAGGWVVMHYGWRAAFLVAGLPGVVLALVLRMVVREPVRTLGTGGAVPEAAPGFGATFRFIRSQHALCHVLVTTALTSGATTGVMLFAASFLIRSHGVTIAQAGLLIGVFYGVVGFVSSIVAGRVVDALAARDERWRTWFCAISTALAAPAVALLTMSPGVGGAVLGLALLSVFTIATYGPLLALLQSLAAARMRGTVTALFYLFAYLLGSATVPLIVGRLSDALTPAFGAQSLRYAVLAMTVLYLWASVHFLLASRTVRRELEAAATI